MAEIIAVLNPKGGCGKTTLTTNLARAFQLDGQQVLIIDTDRQGTARDWRQSQPEDSELPPVVGGDNTQLQREVPQLEASFDVIFIDGAAQVQEMVVSAVKAADFVLIPVQPSMADLWAVDELVELIDVRREITDGALKAAFVVSRQKKNTNLAGAISRPLEDRGLPVLEGRTSDLVAYAEALSFGSTVLDYEPSSTAAQEIRDVYASLQALMGAGATRPGAGRAEKSRSADGGGGG